MEGDIGSFRRTGPRPQRPTFELKDQVQSASLAAYFITVLLEAPARSQSVANGRSSTNRIHAPATQQLGGIVSFQPSAGLNRYRVEQYGHWISACSPMLR